MKKGRNSARSFLVASLILLTVASVRADADDPTLATAAQAEMVPRTEGVCPPFFLRDERGAVINPQTGQNADQPYSPRQTCGACHDYEKITRGYHFTQGKGEEPTADQARRVGWATSPGNYGGTWCSPAPLYRYLSPQRNDSPATMDMTSFDFVTVGCAKCHPGGGPLEFDRSGRRYDHWMQDPASGFAPGAENDLDGDYHRARWSQTGVLEADCLLCHLPSYRHDTRNGQLERLNFRWAATAGAGLGQVEGSVADGDVPRVVYDSSRFDADGRLAPHLVRHPRNEACLNCHAQPGWKKRGADYRHRTDVHLAAGLRCVDCHPSGSSADDPRINAREQHDLAKGDDPGGHVRDDLDGTVRDCADCHDTGRFGAPVARHPGLPSLHLERIACQTCHVPERLVKPISFQASDVFNPGTKIPSKGKHLWTFYGPDMQYRNHYGYLVMMGFDDKPTEPFRPVLARYQGKIWPVNRVHTAWPGIQVEGQAALLQPRMGDVYRMWRTHLDDPAAYPQLAKIQDDDGDGVIEVDRPEEIDAVIASVTSLLESISYPLAGKRVVWVYNDRIYRSGTDHQTLPMHDWEASPYGNVHKYSHGVYPAHAALGSDGCTECHAPGSEFFHAAVPRYPLVAAGATTTSPQYALMGFTSLEVAAGVWREAAIKPLAYLLTAVALALLLLTAMSHQSGPLGRRHPLIPWVIMLIFVVGAFLVGFNTEGRHSLEDIRRDLDQHHLIFATLVMFAGLWTLGAGLQRRDQGYGRHLVEVAGFTLVGAGIGIAAASGFVMLLDVAAWTGLTRAAYTGFDAALVLVLLGTGVALLVELVRRTFRRQAGSAFPSRKS